jgi:acyl-CoA dehydrogenase
MDFEESDEQRLIRQSVARLCQEFPDDYWEQHDREGVFPDDFFKQMAAAGWIGVAMPERYGGAGKGIQEAAIILEEVAASGAAMNGATAIHLSIFGMHPVVKHGSEAMREKYLPAVASGKMHVAFGVTEPDAGSDTTAIETFARREGDH